MATVVPAFFLVPQAGSSYGFGPRLESLYTDAEPVTKGPEVGHPPLDLDPIPAATPPSHDRYRLVIGIDDFKKVLPELVKCLESLIPESLDRLVALQDAASERHCNLDLQIHVAVAKRRVEVSTVP